MSRMSIGRSMAWMGCMSLLGQIFTWGVTIIVARLLTPEDYGLVGLSGLFTVFAQSVSEMGVGAAVIQRRELSKSQIQSLYGFSLLVGGVMTFIGFLVAPLMAWVFTDDRLRPLVAFQSLIFLLTAAKSMQRNLLVREARFDVIAKFETLARVVTSVCTLVLAASGCGYWALAAQWLFIEFFQLIFFCYLERVVPTLRIRFSEIREVLMFGAGVMMRSIVSQLYALVDTAILGKLATKEFLGAYTFSKQLTNMPFEKIVRIVNQVLYPHMARNQDNLPVLRDWTLKSADLQMLTIAPLYYLLFFCSDEVVNVLLGQNWEDAIFPMKILCIASVFKLSESYNMNCLTALGKVSIQVRYMMLLLLSVGGGMLVTALIVDVKSSLLVWVTVYPVLSVMFSRVLLRSLGLGFLEILKCVKSTLIAQVVMVIGLCVLSVYVYGDVWFTLMIKCIFGFAVYVATLAFIDRGKIVRYARILIPAA